MLGQYIERYQAWRQIQSARKEKELRKAQIELFQSLANSPDFRLTGVPITDAEEFTRVTSGMDCIATTSDIVQGEARRFFREASFYSGEKGKIYYQVTARYTDQLTPFSTHQGIVLDYDETD